MASKNILDKGLDLVYKIGAPAASNAVSKMSPFNVNVKVDVTKDVRNGLLGTAAIIGLAVVGSSFVKRGRR